jgi:hypothetical protein
MLQAPKPTPSSASTSSDKIERFSLTQVNNILLLADRFMDPKQHLIHKEGCKEATFNYFLRKMSLYLKFQNAFESLVARTEVALEKIAKADHLQGEMNHVWARLIKFIFMKGNILKMNDMRMICTRTLFVDPLKRLLNEGIEETFDNVNKKWVANFDKINRSRVQTLMFEFLGQLVRLGYESNTKAIHNFLYLAKKVVKAPENGMTADQIAVTIAPCILNAFHLDNVLCPRHGKADVSYEMKKENQFLTLIIHILLNSNRFDVPFVSGLYSEYHQISYETVYGILMPTLTEPSRLNELVILEQKFRKLAVQGSTYSSEGLKEALSSKDEEPLYSFALTMGKVAIDANRSNRNLRKDQPSLPPLVPPLVFSQMTAAPLPTPGEDAVPDDTAPMHDRNRERTPGKN